MTTTETERTYREIPFRHGICPVCNDAFPVTKYNDEPTFVNKWGITQKPNVLYKHGPRNDRCEGSHQQPLPWLEASRLPTWDELSDRDKGAALMHVWKRYKERDGFYAQKHYPARYIDHPALVGLDDRAASRHAAVVSGGHREAMKRLGSEEHARLYDLALRAENSKEN